MLLCWLSIPYRAAAQRAPAGPATVPSGALSPQPQAQSATPADQSDALPRYPQISAKQSRDADDAYIEGAKRVQHKDLAGAIPFFQRAVQLNPGDRDYFLALLVAREGRVTELVQQATKARLLGNNAQADSLLQQAHTLDPDNSIVSEHLGLNPGPLPTQSGNPPVPANEIGSTLGGPIELTPTSGVHSFHQLADARTLLQTIYRAYNITPVFDSTVNSGGGIQLDIDNVTFADATRIIHEMTRTFAVPIDAKTALLIKDSPDNRQQYVPQIEETVYLPGYSQEQMTDLANVARNVFDIKQVTASSTGGFMLLRGDEPSLKLLNATYADMLDGGTDILFDVNLYEIDSTKVRNLGATLPQSVGGYDILTAGQNLINANQSLIQQATASGLLTLNGTTGQNEITELLFLVGAGVTGASQFANLLGTIGTYSGLPLLGVSIASGATFTAALNSSDSRTLDAVQIRTGNGQATTFRAGSRYPIETAQYSSGISSTLASQLSGININGTSASKLLQQYLGSSTTTVPQFQFEDLGITLKITPHVQHGSDVSLSLDMKIEALGGTSINSIPILNNRAITSTVSLQPGETAMLATLVSRNELKSIDGLPGVSELPGFQGTEQDREFDSDELVVTITPHIVRPGAIHVASKRLAAVHTTPAQ